MIDSVAPISPVSDSNKSPSSMYSGSESKTCFVYFQCWHYNILAVVRRIVKSDNPPSSFIQAYLKHHDKRLTSTKDFRTLCWILKYKWGPSSALNNNKNFLIFLGHAQMRIIYDIVKHLLNEQCARHLLLRLVAKCHINNKLSLLNLSVIQNTQMIIETDSLKTFKMFSIKMYLP